MSRNQLIVSVKAPDFELLDTSGRSVRLSEYTAKGPVVLVLTRGFV